MAETKLEQYRRLIGEAKLLEPKPVTPIEGVSVDPGEDDTVTITTDGEGQELNIRALRIEAKKGLVFPVITLTDAQMDAIVTFWSETKKEAKP